MTAQSPVSSCKIVLLGNSGVGKTSLANTWIQGSPHISVKATIGANHQRKRVQTENGEIEVFLWDTAGQEVYQSLTPLYTRSASLSIICASITDKSSFLSIDNWIHLLQSTCEVIPPIVLAVTKIDLQSSGVYSVEQINEIYSSRFKGIFFTSAQTGEGVEQLFDFAANEGYSFLISNDPSHSVVIQKKAEKKKGDCC